jgi:serine O-acetyltransferase
MEQNYQDWHQTILNTAVELTGEEDFGSSSSYAGLREMAAELLRHLRTAMYPHIFSGDKDGRRHSDICVLSLQNAFVLLQQALGKVKPDAGPYEEDALELIRELPRIKAILDQDVEAAYRGDPAAKSTDEIMLTYPAFEAISVYRIAHKLYQMRVPILPRMMTEHAHQLTGIDIHPGASIGPWFFIDHGTGVVIGETTTIGHHVKLYQGVTLGAKSFDVNPDGSLVKGIKRHPDIGNNVVIYAGATVLGGSTVIGDNCVIGGNVWLTHSVPAGETVLASHGDSRPIAGK